MIYWQREADTAKNIKENGTITGLGNQLWSVHNCTESALIANVTSCRKWQDKQTGRCWWRTLNRDTNFRWACTRAFLSRGTLRELQHFNPLQHSVLPVVCLVTVVPTDLRSLTSSSSVVLGWSLMIILTPWGEILHGAPDQGWSMDDFLFTKLLAVGLVAHSRLVQVYNLVPDVLWQPFGLSTVSGGEEVRMEDTDSVERCLLYT